MEPSNPVDFVRYYNAWRVGGDMDQPDPSTITRMLAELCDHAERLERELETAREQVSSRNKRLADMAREQEQERQDRVQAEKDVCRALGERNDARAERDAYKATLANLRKDQRKNQPETDDDQARDPA